MRKDYNIWKSLKIRETDLGWTEKKHYTIYENMDVKRIRKKQHSLDLQEACDQIFWDTVASGADCVAPSMDPSTLNVMPHMKRKNIESAGSVMFKGFMTQQNAIQKRTLKLLESDTSTVNQSHDFSISVVVGLINRLVDDGIMTNGSELWCFAMSLFEVPIKRELYLTLPNDAVCVLHLDLLGGNDLHMTRVYYLVDKCYPYRNGYMVPYSKTSYHQSQFQIEHLTNMQEAFNRSHSLLRNCIKRSFGILKSRWKILNGMPNFSVQTQIDIIMATLLCITDDMFFNFVAKHPDCVPTDELHDVRGSDTSSEDFYEGSNNMKCVRNDIATFIWNARCR
uniref:DDE Tnp4 domain-containing protein n=1 Tax=Lactuca sativa TaxID=4236 RepID=A0A9R1X6Y0_LACSA|nr:hypothetical protein LSAT_V11C600319420 [Lactuca sativa]